MHLGLAFYDLDKIVFASDCPFDPEKGTMYARETLRIIEGLDMPKADKDKIWHGNLERITGVKFVNKRMSERRPVVIAGAGPTGLMCALALTAPGHSRRCCLRRNLR